MNTITFGGRVFTPSKVVAVGRNYLDHALEMGQTATDEEPILFLKPNSAISQGGGAHNLPLHLGTVHHEVELCFLIGRGGSMIPVEEAENHIAAFAVGLDFTLRERQSAAKAKGEPWDVSKGFDGAAVFGDFLAREAVADWRNLTLSLSIAGDKRQEGHTAKMIHTIPEIIAQASRFYTLEEGDIFMTGTPQGVGPVVDGDIVFAEIGGLPALTLFIRRR